MPDFIKSTIGVLIGLFCVCSLYAQPNIVLIVADDAGYADFGFQGSQVIPTPNLDQLANRGVRFTNAYIQSVCSPSRAILATGQYGGRFGYEQNIPTATNVIGTVPTIGLDPEQVTIFDRLRLLGYKNLVVGKWHLGLHADDAQNGSLLAPGNRPTQQGVDEFFGLLGGSRPYFIGNQTSLPNRLIVETRNANGLVQENIVESAYNNQYLTDVIGDETANYITNEHSSGPFFIFSSFTAPHTPLQAKAEDLAAIDDMNLGLGGNRRIYAAMQLAMDRAIGVILDRIDDPNNDGDQKDSIRDQTLVFFINDNGGDCCDSNTNASSNGVLRNGKGSIWEGGIRVPMIMAGAGITEANQGSAFDCPVHAGDIAATSFEVGGGASNPDLFDGVNLLPFVNGQQSGEPHDVVYIRRPSNLGLACRSGDFKLYHDRNTGFALFDLSTNPNESLGSNLISQMPELVDQLKHRVTDFDVQFQKRRWNVDNIGVNEFRFREGAFQTANWDVANGWTNLSDDNNDGQMRLGPDDGTSSTKIIFRAKNGGDFVSTNNLTRANGLEFMANCIRFVTRPEGLNANHVGTIDGLPVILATSPQGTAPRIELDSIDNSAQFMTFNWETDLLLYDDITVTGNGNDVYIFSGSFVEYRASRNLVKEGTSCLELSGVNSITGQIAINGGQIKATSTSALGLADIFINEDGLLSVNGLLEIQAGRNLLGLGQVNSDVLNDGVTDPGQDSITGKLNLNGQYIQGVNGRLVIDVDGPDAMQFDQLEITNSVSLAGTLEVNVNQKIANKTELHVVVAANGVNGQFDSVSFSGQGNWSVDYRSDGVWIVAQEPSVNVTLVDSIDVSNGTISLGGIEDLSVSDDNVLSILASPKDKTNGPVQFIVSGTLPGEAIQSLVLTIEASANSPNLDLVAEGFNFVKNEFQEIGQLSLPLNDGSLELTYSNNPSEFIQQPSQLVLTRIRAKGMGPQLFFPWSIYLDRLNWLSTNE